MRLPPDYQITSLDDLRRFVAETQMARPFTKRDAEDALETIAAGGILQVGDREIEMTKEQYGRYKELVWRRIQQEDPIRRFDGMEIVLSTPEATKTGGGSV